MFKKEIVYWLVFYFVDLETQMPRPVISTYKADFVSPYQLKMFNLTSDHFRMVKGISVSMDYRPYWLTNPKSGHPLELDIFVESTKPIVYYADDGVKSYIFPSFGIEVQGKTHYKVVREYNKTLGGLREQQWRDRVKRRLCKTRNVVLLYIDNSEVNSVKSFDLWLTTKLFGIKNPDHNTSMVIKYFIEKQYYRRKDS